MRLHARYLRCFELAALSGLYGQHYAELVRRLWAVHSDTGRRRPWGLSFADRVLVVAMYLRINLTGRQLAVLFDVSQKQVDRVLHDLTVSVGELLGPSPEDRHELWIVDGTLIATRDHTRTAL